MNDPPLPITTKKTLRRKPPPLLDPDFGLPSPTVLPVFGNQTPEPQFTQSAPPEIIPTPTTPKVIPVVPPRPAKHTPITPQINLLTVDTELPLATFEDYDNSFASYESQRLKGPKELPDYNSPYVPQIQRTEYPRRRLFQQLSRSTSHPSPQPSPPYPTSDVYLDLDYDTLDILPPELSGDSSYRTERIITDSLDAPDLTNSTYPVLIPRLRQSSNNAYDIDRHNTLGGFDTPRNNSPTRAQTLVIPGRHSPTNPPYPSSPTYPSYSNASANEAFSNSPTKYSRSPSMVYGYGSFSDNREEGEEEVDEVNINDYDNDYENQERNSKWVSYNTSVSNQEFDYDDFTETPTTNYFDYSILPDLPSATSSYEPGSPTKKLSFIATKRDSNSSITTNPILSRKRKDDALPPVPLDLPQLPFSSSSLVSQHFATCEAIWSLNSIFRWCLKLRIWLHDLFIPRKEFKKALIKLLAFHRRDIPLDLIGHNADQILESFLVVGAIRFDYGTTESTSNSQEKPLPKEDPGVILDEGAYVNGVLTDLTACYYRGEHDAKDIKLRCYSTHCHLNRIIDHELQLKNTNIDEIVLGEDWASHWKLTAVDLKSLDKSVAKKQSLIFDLLRYEQTFIQRAKCFVEEVGPEFVKAARILVGSNEITLLNKFEDDVLTPGQELVEIHQRVLFKPLLRILIQDGRFVKNLTEIANIYYAWSLEVKNSLLKYMSTVPMIESLLHNEALKRWVDVDVRKMKRVQELKINGPLLFMSTFNSRYQQLPLQLSDIRNHYDAQEPEYASLTKSLDGIKKLGAKVNAMKVHADNIHALKSIHKTLIWKHNIRQPNINLGSENRKFIFRGDVSRKGDLKINSYLNHIILLDNYVFITERIKGPRVGLFNYKVIETPIPVELLLVEEKDTSSGMPISKTLTSLSAPGTSPIPADLEDDDFPFKVRYAGRGKHNSYTFITKSERERSEWLAHFTEARSNLCRRLHKTEPYALEWISNTHFAYESGNRILKLQVCAPNDPIYDISVDAKDRINALGFSNDIYNLNIARNHIVYSSVESISVFVFKGTKFYLIGLVSGVYCSDLKSRWKKVVSGTEIVKISVVSSINLLVILGNKHLRYHALDLIVDVYYERRKTITSVSLSNDPVSFFSIGRHREISMLFYAKKKTNSGSTNFKVLIPETDNDGVFSAFKVVKKFYVQAECFGISIFNTSFAVHTNKGIEVLELDKLLPRSIPEIPLAELGKKIDGYSRKLVVGGSATGIEIIRKAVLSTNLRPMGMFKLTNNTEFLLVYNDCAVFTNKHGKLSRYSMLLFDFKAKSIAFVNNNLFLVCEEAIEIWSISDFVNGTNKLIQVIVGKDISMINSEDLCFAMANPKVMGLQLVFLLKPRAQP